LARDSTALAEISDGESWFEHAQNLFSCNHCSVFFLQAGNDQVKRLILGIVGSKLLLRDKTLNIEAVKPFRHWTGTASSSDLCGYVEDIRTLWTSADPVFVDMVARIRQLLEMMESSKQPLVA
jgi:hypothetical protein